MNIDAVVSLVRYNLYLSFLKALSCLYILSFVDGALNFGIELVTIFSNDHTLLLVSLVAH